MRCTIPVSGNFRITSPMRSFLRVSLKPTLFGSGSMRTVTRRKTAFRMSGTDGYRSTLLVHIAQKVNSTSVLSMIYEISKSFIPPCTYIILPFTTRLFLHQKGTICPRLRNGSVRSTGNKFTVLKKWVNATSRRSTSEIVLKLPGVNTRGTVNDTS